VRLRDALLSSARFRALATRFPPTRPIARRRARALFDLCAGFVYSQVLLALVQLRIPEILRDSPLTAAQLARRLDLPESSAERLLLAAVSLRLLSSRSRGRFGLGPLGAALIDNPGVTGMITHHPLLYDDLRDPVALLRQAGKARETASSLAAYWPYAAGGAAPSQPAQTEAYTALMSASQPMIAAEVLAAYPVRRHRRLLDVGGGGGAFVAACLSRTLHGTVFDLPPVVALARARFEQAGLSGRADVVGGDFVRESLPGGADLISLVRVLHDHDDDVALSLLRRIRDALPPHGTLLLAEPMAGTVGAAPAGEAYFGFYLLAMGSGRPRRPERIIEMLRQTGFSRIRLARTRTPLLARLLVARP
jgi:demethylspheroidene O-methyltransferase